MTNNAFGLKLAEMFGILPKKGLGDAPNVQQLPRITPFDERQVPINPGDLPQIDAGFNFGGNSTAVPLPQIPVNNPNLPIGALPLPQIGGRLVSDEDKARLEESFLATEYAKPPSERVMPTIPIEPEAEVMPEEALPTIGISPREQEFVDLGDKDYSIKKDENGNVIHRGKDRDKNWTLGDKIKSALVGWAQGGLAGGIGAATDRNFFEKMGDDNQRARLLPQIAAEQQINARNADLNKKIQDPILRSRDLKRKIEKDAATVAYWNRKADQGDLKLAGDDELRALRDKWATSKDKTDQKRLGLAEKEMENRNLRAEADRKSREGIAANRETGVNNRYNTGQAGTQARFEVKNKSEAAAALAKLQLAVPKEDEDPEEFAQRKVNAIALLEAQMNQFKK